MGRPFAKKKFKRSRDPFKSKKKRDKKKRDKKVAKIKW